MIPITSRRVAAIVVLALSSGACHATTFYSATGTSRVIDALNGQPVAGVIVEASWEITNDRDPAAAPLAQLMYAEARMNANGEFTLPAWGPVTMNLQSSVRSVVKRLDHSQPHLFLYKSGYRSSVEKGPREDPRPFLEQLRFSGEDRRIAWWDQHTFKLEPDHGSIQQRRHELSMKIAALSDCKWVHRPRIAAAYVMEARQLARVDPPRADPAVERILAESCPDTPRPLAAYFE